MATLLDRGSTPLISTNIQAKARRYVFVRLKFPLFFPFISPLFPLDFPTEHRYLIRKCVHKESKMSIIFIVLIVHNEYEFI